MEDSNTENSLLKRLKPLNHIENPDNGKCIIYVMSRDQRVSSNHALLIAQKEALEKNLPLGVVFCLKKTSATRSKEQYLWMLEGLKQIEKDLKMLNIPFLLLIGDSFERISGCIRHLQPEGVYFDMNPLKGTLKLQKRLAEAHNCRMYVVDTHNVVPIWETSDKQEYGARTIRPKIHRKLAEYLLVPPKLIKHPYAWRGPVINVVDLSSKISQILNEVPSNGQKPLYNNYPLGEKGAKTVLNDFIENRLRSYASARNDPSLDGLSGLSPYLHYGMISSLQVALEVLDAATEDSSLQVPADVLIEEMVVRKELSDNYCYYNNKYDSLDGAPEWAKVTLQKHLTDPREFLYTLEDFEKGKTHDNAWNAAQKQLVKAGKMHGYMRMYWAKKVLEWSETPQDALKTLIYLNDFYSIDGGDPNGYVGILWSVAGLHDRPWGERPVYGTVRCMVYSGLKRKFDIEKYQDKYLV